MFAQNSDNHKQLLQMQPIANSQKVATVLSVSIG